MFGNLSHFQRNVPTSSPLPLPSPQQQGTFRLLLYKTIKCRGFLGCLFSTLVSGKRPKCPPFGVSCSRCLSRILCQADSSRSTTPSPPDPSPGVLSLVHAGSEQVCAQLVSAAPPACPPSVPAVGRGGQGSYGSITKGRTPPLNLRTLQSLSPSLSRSRWRGRNHTLNILTYRKGASCPLRNLAGCPRQAGRPSPEAPTKPAWHPAPLGSVNHVSFLSVC